MPHHQPDEIFAGTGAGNRHAIIGIATRADDGRIPYPSGKLVGHAARGGRRSQIAPAIQRHRPHSAHFRLLVERISGEGKFTRRSRTVVVEHCRAGLPRLRLMQLSQTVFRVEVRIGHEFHAVLAEERHRAVAGHQDMRRLLHDHTGRPDRVLDAVHARKRAGPQRAAVHDRGVHLMGFGTGINRAAPGIEQRAVLKHGHGQRHRIKGGGSGGQRVPPFLQNGLKGAAVFALRLSGKGFPVDCARAAVNSQNRNLYHERFLQKNGKESPRNMAHSYRAFIFLYSPL